MRAEIISVGTELLLGQTVDTNAAYLSRDLAARGILLYHRETVGDNHERLLEALQIALARSEVVITIGGLGPTEDDITRETAARAAGMNLVPDPESEAVIRAFFARRNLPFSSINLKQALAPERGSNLPNPNGTAPGAAFDLGDKAIICLPGPPIELEPMWQEAAIPWLSEKGFSSGKMLRSRMLRLAGIGESQLEPMISDLLHDTNPTVAPYAKTGEVHLRISAMADCEERAMELISEREALLRERVGQWVYGVDEETLETVVVRDCVAKGVKIATAESCTGGLVASRITDVPGSSETFVSGLVCYANDAKTNILGVPAVTISRHGAVSEEVAIAMAKGALERSGADIAVSDTGIAGPGGGTQTKPVGLVWIGVATQSKAFAIENHFVGSRTTVKRRASQAALLEIRKALADL